MEHVDRGGEHQLRVAWFGHAEGRRADGLSAYSRVVVQALRARGVRVKFFHHDLDGDETPSPESVAIGGWRGKTVTVSARRAAAQIEREMVEFAPDVVHLSWSFSLLDAKIGEMARMLGCSSVATFHLPHGDPGSFRAWIMQRLYRFHRGGLLNFDRCIALSQPQRDLLVKVGYPAHRMTVLQNAVDTGLISPGNSDLKRKLDADFVFGFIGRLDPEKRPLQLIDTFLKLGLPPNSVLALAGRGSLEAKVAAAAAKFSNVKHVGLLANDQQRLEFLRGCDVFVLPSTAEGLALSLLEAMAAGKAIIATDAGDDGPALSGAGVVIPTYPLNPGLADAMRQLHADSGLRHQSGMHARQRAEAKFSMARHIDEIISVYKEIISWHQNSAA